MISARTKAGLQAAKARSKKLGTDNLPPELQQEASAKGVTVIKQNNIHNKSLRGPENDESRFS
jgi:DNA invertase Pin-like site-specific DNA recombinase